MGQNQSSPIEFEWPTEKDILAMPTDRPIKLISIQWKRLTYPNAKVLGGI
jgi:hypothetical protein